MRSNLESMASTFATALVTGDSPSERVSQTYEAICDVFRPLSKCDYLRDSGVKAPMLEIDEKRENQVDDEDPEEVAATKNLFQKYFFSFFVSMAMGLYCLLHIPSVTLVLKSTKTSDNPLRAFLRYFDTLLHAVKWFESPTSRHSSLKTVRTLHRNAYRRMAKQGVTVAFSQYDLVLTQWAFVSGPILFGESLGFNRMTEEEKSLYVKTFYKVGRDLGISDEHNLCSGTLEEATDYARSILKQIFRPAMTRVRDSGMAEVMLKGINILNPLVDPEAFATFTRNMVLREHNLPDKSYSRAMLSLQKLVFDWLFHCVSIAAYLQAFLNFMMRLNIRLARRWKKSMIKDNMKHYKL